MVASLRDGENIRICVLSHSCVLRVNQQKWVSLAENYPDVDVLVIAPQVWKSTYGPRQVFCLERPERDPIRMVGVWTSPNWKSITFSYGPAVLWHMARFRPHIVQVDEEPFSFAGFQGVFLGRLFGSRVVLSTFQNRYIRMPFPFRAIESLSLRNSEYVIAGTEEVRQVVIRKIGTLSGRTAVIPHGIDPHLFRKIEAGDTLRTSLGIGSFTIGYVGVLTKQKGIDTLLRALSGITKQWKLLIVGDGPSRGNLIGLAEELGCASNLLFVGQVPHSEVPRYMNCMDALVLPSVTTPRLREQMGRVLGEAMACEVPVIGSSSGQIPDFIGNAGLVFKEGDSGELREKIEQLMNDDDLCRELSARGKERVYSEYTWEVAAQKTYRVFQEVMQQ